MMTTFTGFLRCSLFRLSGRGVNPPAATIVSLLSAARRGSQGLTLRFLSGSIYRSMPHNSSLPHPGVRFPPAFLYVGALAIAWLLEFRVRRFRFVGVNESTAAIETAGIFLVVIGVALGLWGMLTFARARTAILPIKAASRLVETGPYRISRNPMYTGMSIAYLGLMLRLNWGWALVLFPVVIVLLHRFVISKEERYLLAEFGEEYAAYCRRVRRWI